MGTIWVANLQGYSWYIMTYNVTFTNLFSVRGNCGNTAFMFYFGDAILEF